MRTITIGQANNDLIGYINYTLDTHDEEEMIKHHIDLYNVGHYS